MVAGVVDVCLIPEVNFAMDGEQGLMAYLRRLLADKGHCVICVAEGAGQVLCPSPPPPPRALPLPLAPFETAQLITSAM